MKCGTVTTAIMLLLMGTLTTVTGCSSDVPVLSEKSESEIDSQADKVASESESSSAGLPTEAQRAYEVTETPEVPARDDAERQRTGIVSSFDNETLQLNEDGHVFSYRLAKDVSVYYPGGKTGLMDLRQGDEITVFLEDDVSLRKRADRSDGDVPADGQTPTSEDAEGGAEKSGSDESELPPYVVRQIEKHTESVDRS